MWVSRGGFEVQRLDAQRGVRGGDTADSSRWHHRGMGGGKASTPTFSVAVVVVETQPCWCFPRDRGNTTKHREGSLRDGGHKRCGEDG